MIGSAARPAERASSERAGHGPDRVRNDLHAITRDGVWFSIMVGLGESYVPAFAVAMGLGAVAAGLIATLPMLAGAVLQLVTPWGVRWLASYRRWVVLCATFQALSFLPLVAGVGLGRVDGWLIGGAMLAYWTFGMGTSPAWNAWVTSLVPAELRDSFFARRTRAAQAGLLGALIVAGIALEIGPRYGFEATVFAALFLGALAARLRSAQALASQSEPPGLAATHRTLHPVAVWQSLRGADSLRVLRYLLALQVTTHIAAPFFTPFMLSGLGLSYGEFMAITASAFLARVAFLPWLGRVVSRHGTGRLLWLGGLGVAPMPLLWLVSDGLAWLLLIQLVGGLAWGAIELATTLSFFEGIDDRERASVLSVFNFANAVAIAGGSLIGAELLGRIGPSPEAYAWIFGISAAGRLLAAGWLRSTKAPRHVATDIQLRTLAVRPSGVALQPPILASLEEDESHDDDDEEGGPGDTALRRLSTTGGGDSTTGRAE